jgi:hypothetical protein
MIDLRDSRKAYLLEQGTALEWREDAFHNESNDTLVKSELLFRQQIDFP